MDKQIAYTYTTEEWGKIAEGLQPSRYRTHRNAAAFIAAAVDHAKERGHHTVTLYPYGECYAFRDLFDRRIQELGL